MGGTHSGAKLMRALTHGVASVLTDMPAFGSALSADQLQGVNGYVLQVAAQNPSPQ